MSSENNKALVRRFLAINEGKAAALAAIDEIYSTDVVFHNSHDEDICGLKDFKQYNSEFLSAVPDAHFTFDDMVAEGDEVVTRWTMTGTHTGASRSIPATNKKLTIRAITIDRISVGKIVEEWERSDTLGVMQQLGLIPTRNLHGGENQ